MTYALNLFWTIFVRVIVNRNKAKTNQRIEPKVRFNRNKKPSNVSFSEENALIYVKSRNEWLKDY